MIERFSTRHGYDNAAPEITVREDAPRELRSVVVDIAYEAGLTPGQLREVVCRVLRIQADPYNWSDFPNIDREVRLALRGCEWSGVYDVIEEIPGAITDGSPAEFEYELNMYFIRKGIGWQITDGLIEVRGPEPFEVAISGALDNLSESDRETAHTELREALSDLSRRPVDKTGAVQHAVAAMECVARDISGDSNATLGRLINQNPGMLPRPLDTAVEKIWGYASNRGRHLREGETISYEEAELIVTISAAVCSYLVQNN